MANREQETNDKKVEVYIQPLEYEGTPVSGLASMQAHPLGGYQRVKKSGASAIPIESLPYPYPPVSTPVSLHDEAQATEGSLHEVSRSVQAATEEGSQTASNLAKDIPKTGLPVAHPPPHVMTALGPMPLPPEIRKKIPEKFVAKPIIEEREIYVAKKEVQERTIEVPHVQYEHKFAEIQKTFNVKKIIPSVKEIVKEVPREIYKPVIEEKVIEMPQGVKYVEVPVEVPCLYPPKIVPKPVTQIVERVVETIKPIVQEKIIEVPQTVVKNIPKIKTVEVPYYVPRYVEKLIEIPYQPPEAGLLPQTLTSQLPTSLQGPVPKYPPMLKQNEDFPPSFAGTPVPFSLRPMPLSGINEIQLPYEAKIEVRVLHPQDQAAQQQLLHETFGPSREGSIQSSTRGKVMKYPYSMQLPAGIQWGAPKNAPLPPEQTSYGSNIANMAKMPPMMVTFPPEVGNVSFGGQLTEPDILTRSGVIPYQGFKRTGNAQMLFPPLPAHDGVPVEDGVPNIELINQHAAQFSDGIVPDATQPTSYAEGEYRQRQVDSTMCAAPFAVSDCCTGCEQDEDSIYFDA